MKFQTTAGLFLLGSNVLIARPMETFESKDANPVYETCNLEPETTFSLESIIMAQRNYYKFRQDSNVDMICYFLHSNEVDFVEQRSSWETAELAALLRTWKHMTERLASAEKPKACDNRQIIKFETSVIHEAIMTQSIFNDADQMCYFLVSQENEIVEERKKLGYFDFSTIKSLEILQIISDHWTPYNQIREEYVPEWRTFMLESTVHSNDLRLFEILLKDTRTLTNGNMQNENPLLIAASLGHVKMVQLLLQDGRSIPSYDKNYAYKRALISNHVKVVELLLEDGRIKRTRDLYFADKEYLINHGYNEMKNILERYEESFVIVSKEE